MDAVLRQTIRVAHTIRDSAEGGIWREAWNTLLDVQPSAQNIVELPIEDIPVIDHIGHLRLSDPALARPLMFPLLLSLHPHRLTAEEIRRQLAQHPEILSAYQQLSNALGLTALIVTFLRMLGPGYPHQHLVYTLPDTPWSDLNNLSELPWNMGEFLLPGGATDANFIGLNSFIPSASHQLAEALNDLVRAIRSHAVWLQLEKSYRAIERHPNLCKEMSRAMAQFEREYGAIGTVNMPRSFWRDKAHELAQKVYAKRGARIQGYADDFLEYEWLIERVYWMISQLAMYEVISCISSSEPDQLQQVTLSCGHDALLSALAPTFAKTLQVGQLIHIALPESDHVLDGIYQTQQWVQLYRVASGERLLFRARCLWYCHLEDLGNVIEEAGSPIFVPTEALPVLGESYVTGLSQNGQPQRIKDVMLGLVIPRSMNLP